MKILQKIGEGFDEHQWTDDSSVTNMVVDSSSFSQSVTKDVLHSETEVSQANYRYVLTRCEP